MNFTNLQLEEEASLLYRGARPDVKELEADSQDLCRTYTRGEMGSWGSLGTLSQEVEGWLVRKVVIHACGGMSCVRRLRRLRCLGGGCRDLKSWG